MALRRDRHGHYIPLECDGQTVSWLAQQDKVPWYEKPNLCLLYLFMVPACLGVEMTSGFDASMINGLQAVPSWLEYYHYPHSASLGLMTSMYSLGCFAATPFVSSVVDKIGRRYSILLGGMISIVGGTLQGSALNFTMFLIARFLLGFANIFSIVGASSLIGELSHPKERAIMGAFLATLYDIGAIAAAVVTLGTFSMTSNLGWRIPSFLQAFPSLLQVVFIWFVPESPRWLVSNGRAREAYAILVKYHAEGDESSDFVNAEYRQIEQTLEAEMKAAQTSWKMLFSTPVMRKRIIITSFFGMFTQWSGLAIISYYLVVVLDGIGIHDNWTKNLVNLARFSWSLVNSVAIASIAPRYPRRKMFLACTISIFVVFTALTLANAEYSLTHSNIAAQAVLILVFLYSPAYNLAFMALKYPFLVELFPFHIRAKGITIFKWWSYGAGFAIQFINPIGIDAIGWRWYIVYCVWNAFQVVFVYCLWPETSGRTLEELTCLFGDDQETLRHTEVEVVHHDFSQAETYGTMGEHSDRRTASRGK